MGTTLIIVSALKLAGACGVGLGASAMMKAFHEYEFNFKKKGDKNERNIGKSVREKSEGLS